VPGPNRRSGGATVHERPGSHRGTGSAHKRLLGIAVAPPHNPDVQPADEASSPDRAAGKGSPAPKKDPAHKEPGE